MKPERLSLDHNSSSAAKEWRHWKKTLENYFESFPRPAEGEEAVNKLHVFTECIDFKVYEVIEECTTYVSTIEILDNLYVKTPSSVIFLICSRFSNAIWLVFNLTAAYSKFINQSS